MIKLQVKQETCDRYSYNELHNVKRFYHTETALTSVKTEPSEPMAPRTIEELFAAESFIIPKYFQIYKSRRHTSVRTTELITENMGKEQILTQPFADLEEYAELESPPSRKRRSQSGKRAGKGNGTSPYTTVPLPPCKVCGGVATGYHFGVITCEACKVSMTWTWTAQMLRL